MTKNEYSLIKYSPIMLWHCCNMLHYSLPKPYFLQHNICRNPPSRCLNFKHIFIFQHLYIDLQNGNIKPAKYRYETFEINHLYRLLFTGQIKSIRICKQFMTSPEVKKTIKSQRWTTGDLFRDWSNVMSVWFTWNLNSKRKTKATLQSSIQVQQGIF